MAFETLTWISPYPKKTLQASLSEEGLHTTSAPGLLYIINSQVALQSVTCPLEQIVKELFF